MIELTPDEYSFIAFIFLILGVFVTMIIWATYSDEDNDDQGEL